MSETDANSYGQILKSSSIMGGVAAVTLILGMIRTKFAAVIIGTTGVGLIASFMAIQGFVGAIAGMGIQSSAVREVAAAYAKGDEQVVGETVLMLRRICWLTGLLGAVGMMLLSPFLSQLTFGSNEYQWDIAALGLIILFTNLSGGQTALLQGARRIADMAKAQVVGAVAGTVITVTFYFWLGLPGVIPALVSMAAVQFVISWYFARRLPVPKIKMTWGQSFNKSGAIVKLGLIMMFAGLAGSLITYATTALITQVISVPAVGIYSAAFALSGMFVNFVYGAMGADYYPRLTGSIGNNEKTAQLVREQTEVGLFLALPGLLVTMYGAPWFVTLFYSNEFVQAAKLIEIFILGCFARIVAWPMGLIVLAAGKAWLFLSIEIGLLGFQLIFVVLLLPIFGLPAVAWAFTVVALMNIVLEVFVAKHLVAYQWTSKKKKTVLLASAMISFSYFFVYFMAGIDRLIVGFLAIVLVTFFCGRALIVIIENSEIKKPRTFWLIREYLMKIDRVIASLIARVR